MSKISFIKSDDRRYNIERCLSLIKSEVISVLKDCQNVVIKPNCVVDNNKLAATSVEALDALLEFISPYVSSQIVLAEGTGIGDTMKAFTNYGYFSLQEKYDFAILDLNNDDFEMVNIIDQNRKNVPIQASKTILNSDCLISITPPKTHNEVVFSGGIKNVVVGSLLRPSGSLPARLASRLGLYKNSKTAIHQGYFAINRNIFSLFNKIPLKLSIIDGFESMEGEGPIDGDLVPSHWAIASSDPIAADFLACQLMGIDIADIGYLALLEQAEEDKSDYFVTGDDWKKSVKKFKMHSNFDKMKEWK